jgi:hypothetical protein
VSSHTWVSVCNSCVMSSQARFELLARLAGNQLRRYVVRAAYAAGSERTLLIPSLKMTHISASIALFFCRYVHILHTHVFCIHIYLYILYK